MDMIFFASLETRNFSFEAFDIDEERARYNLIEALEAHGKQYDLDVEWFVEWADSIEVHERRIGKGYRDGSEI